MQRFCIHHTSIYSMNFHDMFGSLFKIRSLNIYHRRIALPEADSFRYEGDAHQDSRLVLRIAFVAKTDRALYLKLR